MAKTPVSDVVIWAKHIHGDSEMLARLNALRGGETIELLIDGVPGVWRKMSDGKDGRPTSGLRPIGAAQTFWKDLYAARRGEVVELQLAPDELFQITPNPSIIEESPATMEERMAALERFLSLGRMGYSSEGRTMTRDEMHER